MTIYRKVRKLVRKGGQAIKKRYVSKRGAPKVNRMAKDIMYLKSVLNPEKKRHELSVSNQLIGQVNGNDDGGYYVDVTPFVAIGSGFNERTGASIKLHSTVWHFQFSQQSSVISKMRGVIEIWKVVGDPSSGFTWRDEHWLPNPFTGVRDMNCQINADNYMKGVCIARRNFAVQSDQLGNEKLITDVKIPIKYNKGQGHHVRYDKNNQYALTNGQLYLVIRTDRGNIGTAPSTLNVPDVAANTGILMQYNKIDYYYDN